MVTKLEIFFGSMVTQLEIFVKLCLAFQISVRIGDLGIEH